MKALPASGSVEESVPTVVPEGLASGTALALKAMSVGALFAAAPIVMVNTFSKVRLYAELNRPESVVRTRIE